MFKALSLDEGRLLIKIARSEILNRLKAGHSDDVYNVPQRIATMRLPIFVSIEKIVQTDSMRKRVLRGLMGIIRPVNGLVDSVKIASVYAAFNDPRYSPVTASEFKSCILELTVLSDPRLTSLDDLSDKMILGYHAVLISTSDRNVLLLPQRQAELAEAHWRKQRRRFTVDNLVEYIKQILNGRRLRERLNVYMYETQIFYELEPDGLVIERRIYLNRLFEQRNGHNVVDLGKPQHGGPGGI